MNKETNNKVNININIMLPKEQKQYYTHQLKTFAEQFNSKKVLNVQYGKQDIRGTVSITIIDKKHCVPRQKHFNNKWELLGFVIGYNSAKEKTNYNYFKEFLK